MVTLKDLATACGVSTATVSRALNNQSDVSPATAERIRRIATEMGYFPNAAARALKTNRSYNIGVLYENQMDHEYFSMIIDTIRHFAELRGYDITFLSKGVGADPMNYYDHAKYRGLDGVIIVQGDFENPGIVKLAQSGFPCVVLDYPYEGCDCINSDNTDGVAQIVNAAISLGHTRIAFIHGETGGDVTGRRIEGYRKAMREHGLEIPDGYIRQGNYHEPARCGEATKELMSLPTPPTCILYPDDFAALGGISQLERLGCSVPNTVSIAGYDGIRLASMLRPRLTTWCQDFDSIGQLAVSLITNAIENPGDHIPSTHFVTGFLSEGGTLAKCPES